MNEAPSTRLQAPGKLQIPNTKSGFSIIACCWSLEIDVSVEPGAWSLVLFLPLMSISSNGKLVMAATKELWLRWEETKASWQDAKSAEFERRYLLELQSAVDRALPVFTDLDKLIEKVRTDCE